MTTVNKDVENLLMKDWKIKSPEELLHILANHTTRMQAEHVVQATKKAIEIKNSDTISNAMEDLGNEIRDWVDRMEHVTEEFGIVLIQSIHTIKVSLDKNSSTNLFLTRSTLALASVGLWATIYFGLMSVQIHQTGILYWTGILAWAFFLIWFCCFLFKK